MLDKREIRKMLTATTYSRKKNSNYLHKLSYEITYGISCIIIHSNLFIIIIKYKYITNSQNIKYFHISASWSSHFQC